MNRFDELMDALKVETLTDMANNFFGSRKDIDDEKEAFGREAAKVRRLGQRVLLRAALLHALLVNDQEVRTLYRELAVPCGQMTDIVDNSKAQLDRSIPFRLTARSRYLALLRQAYDSTRIAFELYMNGRYYKDPREPRIKRLTMHYGLLKDWCGHINRRVRKVNESLAPSCVLSFAKSLDGNTLQQEKVMDSGIPGSACDLDQSMAMQQVDCLEYGLFELPSLPDLDKARPILDRIGTRLFKTNGKELKTLMRELSAQRKLPTTIPAPKPTRVNGGEE